MTYEVVISAEAQSDVMNTFDRIFANDPAAATRWLSGINRAFGSLADLPHRCPPAREDATFPGRGLRQLVHRSHRIVYDVDDAAGMVVVHHALLGRQRAAGEPEEDDRSSPAGG